MAVSVISRTVGWEIAATIISSSAIEASSKQARTRMTRYSGIVLRRRFPGRYRFGYRTSTSRHPILYVGPPEADGLYKRVNVSTGRVSDTLILSCDKALAMKRKLNQPRWIVVSTQSYRSQLPVLLVQLGARNQMPTLDLCELARCPVA